MYYYKYYFIISIAVVVVVVVVVMVSDNVSHKACLFNEEDTYNLFFNISNKFTFWNR